MSIVKISQSTGVGLKSIQSFMYGKREIGLMKFRKLLSVKDQKILDNMISRTKDGINKNKGKQKK